MKKIFNGIFIIVVLLSLGSLVYACSCGPTTTVSEVRYIYTTRTFSIVYTLIHIFMLAGSVVLFKHKKVIKDVIPTLVLMLCFLGIGYMQFNLPHCSCPGPNVIYEDVITNVSISFIWIYVGLVLGMIMLSYFYRKSRYSALVQGGTVLVLLRLFFGTHSFESISSGEYTLSIAGGSFDIEEYPIQMQGLWLVTVLKVLTLVLLVKSFLMKEAIINTIYAFKMFRKTLGNKTSEVFTQHGIYTFWVLSVICYGISLFLETGEGLGYEQLYNFIFFPFFLAIFEYPLIGAIFANITWVVCFLMPNNIWRRIFSGIGLLLSTFPLFLNRLPGWESANIVRYDEIGYYLWFAAMIFLFLYAMGDYLLSVNEENNRSKINDGTGDK